MKTKRLVSTIGYNTEGFLASTLDRLVNAGLIDWAHYIRHEPEEDEAKAHWHIVLMPAKSVDTNALAKQFQEVDLAHPDKPLGVLPFRFSASLDDWLLYAVHDAGYLASKGQRRKYHYARTDVLSTCPDLLAEQWREVNLAKYGLGEVLAEAVKQKLPWEAVIASGVIPPAQWTFWREVYFSLRSGATVKPLRQELTHTPKKEEPSAVKASTDDDRPSLCWSDGTPLDPDDMAMIREWENAN